MVRRWNMVLTNKDARLFCKAARKYTEAATQSKQQARDVLVKLGIYTREGSLTKEYGGG